MATETNVSHDEEIFLTEAEAAARLGFSIQLLAQLRKEGVVKALRIGGRRPRYLWSELRQDILAFYTKGTTTK